LHIANGTVLLAQKADTRSFQLLGVGGLIKGH
jgi:hypothetical protein